MRRRRDHDRAQLVLELDRQPPQPLVRNPNGLVEALADLLLEALHGPGLQTKGGSGERQDQN